MEENKDGSGQFTEVVLRPKLVVEKKEMLEKARNLHQKAHEYCFIARSVNFPVRCEPEISYPLIEKNNIGNP